MGLISIPADISAPEKSDRSSQMRRYVTVRRSMVVNRRARERFRRARVADDVVMGVATMSLPSTKTIP